VTRPQLLVRSLLAVTLVTLLGCRSDAKPETGARAKPAPATPPAPPETQQTQAKATNSSFEVDPNIGALDEGPPNPASASGWAAERPEGRIRPGVPEVSPAEHIELAREAVRRRGWQLRACYEAALPAQPKLAGELRFRFTIDTSGRVGEVEPLGLERFGHAGAAGCMARAIGRWAFPSPPEEVEVVYPFEFRPG
jgi:hypothetical protein